ncbi:hypothetical protein HBI42_219390 [Parastagonospora nodorum]|nr:hypothetical protein HBI47_219630 [Parastagonospora nodorum]KAH6201678.1 hypothetical protein HBI43_216940 [Parastagonospora nodorum]KAH6243368.1 hypothetical protein HBI42_219390 [Parastagonospora nodorum]
MALTKSPEPRVLRKRQARKLKHLSPKPPGRPASKSVTRPDTTIGYTVDVPGVGVLGGFTAPPSRAMRIDDMLSSTGGSTYRTRAEREEDAALGNYMSHIPPLVRGTVPLVHASLPLVHHTRPLINGGPSVSSVHRSAPTSLDNTSPRMTDTPQPLWGGAASTNRSTHATQPTESVPSLPQDTQYPAGSSLYRDNTLYISKELHEDMQYAFRRIAHPPGSSETMLGALTYAMANAMDGLYGTPQWLRNGRQPSMASMNDAVNMMAWHHPASYDPNSTTSSST